MKALLQRASSAKVEVDGRVVGEFAAHMAVSLTNDGPVTILIDSREG